MASVVIAVTMRARERASQTKNLLRRDEENLLEADSRPETRLVTAPGLVAVISARSR
jgi:hypothetical protein